MTNQEAFDTIARHLLRPGYKPCADENGECWYRDATGNRCAVGVLIPDAEYDDQFERKTVYALPTDLTCLNGLHRGFLRGLQQIHDETDCPRSQRIVKLLSAAQSAGLSAEVVREMEGGPE